MDSQPSMPVSTRDRGDQPSVSVALGTAPGALTSARPPEPTSGRRARPTWQLVVAFMAVWMLLTAWHFQILTAPPYYEFACGLFTEANWLVDHQFDYLKLRNDEPIGNIGGARVYMTSILPTLVALLMSSGLSQTTILVVCHLGSLACASLVLVTVFALLDDRIGTAPAALVCLAIATTPLFSVQCEMIGLDLPTAAFAVLAVLFVVRDSPVAASLAALAAFFMKPTGMIASLAILTFLAVRFVFHAPRGASARRSLYLGILANALVLVIQLAVFRWGSISMRLTDEGSMPFHIVNFSDVLTICPDMVILTVAASVVCLWQVGRWMRLRMQEPAPGGRLGHVVSAIGTAWELESRALLAWLIVIGNILAVALYVQFPVPRYFTVGVPLIYAVLGMVLFNGRLKTAWPFAVVSLLVAVNVVNWDGKLFPSMADSPFPRNGAALERSGEYRADQQAILEAVAVLADRCQNAVIIAGHPFPYLLSMPRLGFVAAPLRGYSINSFVRAEFANVSSLFDELPAELVFVSVDNFPYSQAAVTVPAPRARDEILYDDGQPNALRVFRKRLPADRDQRRRWLLENLWYDPTLDRRPSLPLFTRAAILMSAGKADLGIALLRCRVDDEPDNLDARLDLAELQSVNGRPRAAALHCLLVLWKRPRDARAHEILGYCQLLAGRLDEADSHLMRVAQGESRSARGVLRLGLLRVQQGRLDEADTLFADAAADRQVADQALLQRGLLRLSQGKHDEAAQFFQQTLDVNRDAVEAHLQLGMLALNAHNLDQADQHFQNARTLVPRNPIVRNALGLVAYQRRDYLAASEHFAEALRLRPDYAEARANLSQAQGAGAIGPHVGKRS